MKAVASQRSNAGSAMVSPQHRGASLALRPQVGELMVCKQSPSRSHTNPPISPRFRRLIPPIQSGLLCWAVHGGEALPLSSCIISGVAGLGWGGICASVPSICSSRFWLVGSLPSWSCPCFYGSPLIRNSKGCSLKWLFLADLFFCNRMFGALHFRSVSCS